MIGTVQLERSGYVVKCIAFSLDEERRSLRASRLTGSDNVTCIARTFSIAYDPKKMNF